MATDSVPPVVLQCSRERPEPHLGQQIVGGLASSSASQISVDGGLMPADHINERVGAAAD
jgi:hypothetical protein